MNRMALSIAALTVTAATLLYLNGIRAVLVLGLLLCFAAFFGFYYCKRKSLGFKAVAVLLVGAVFCLYLVGYTTYKIERVGRLAGTSAIVTCRVVDEPTKKAGYNEYLVETDGTNGFDSGLTGPVRLIIYIGHDEEASVAVEGDILLTELNFKRTDESLKKYRWSEQVYVVSSCTKAEIIGHKETVYSRCVDLRREIRNGIDANLSGDNAALIKGILLGDISDMSVELLTDFKICGVAHITAVSGMHIGAFCMMVTSLLAVLVGRRRASVFAFIPLVVTVMLAGLTPSAVRSGVMCALTLLADCLLKKTDTLNSLGIAVVAMLLYNPFYILSLGFQLSCAASAGVIIAAPLGARLANKVCKSRFKTVNSIIGSIVNVFVQSIGAVVFTAPFQIIAFGFISLISPLASTMICSASVYAMAVTVVALVMYYIPYVEYLAVIPFWMADLLATYCCVVVHLLAKVPFSYVPFGSNTAIICMGMTLALIALWILLDRPGGKRLVSLFITVLLVAALLGDHIASKDVVEVSALKTGDALCTVISFDGRCIIIGCGNDPDDRYTLRAYLMKRGITEVEALFIPSESESCFGGYEYILEEIAPEITVIPDNFGNSTVFSGGITVASDGASYKFFDEAMLVKAVRCKYGCVFEVSVYEKTMLIGNAYYNADELSYDAIDCIITSRLIPDAKPKLMVISAEAPMQVDQPLRVLNTADSTLSIKLKPKKGMTVYAGQE